MRIAKWDTWQTFRKDRGTPPWIKVYRNLMTNEEWVSLSDSEKGHLVSLWILGADKGGVIPDSPAVLKRMCMLDGEPNINKFIELGFLVGDMLTSDIQVVTTSPESDQPDKSRGRVETEERRVEESRGDLMSGKPDNAAKAILSFLNLKTGKGFKPVPSNLGLINARLKEGHSEHEILGVIERKCGEWVNNEKMEQYLRPATLFGAVKFNQYVGELGVDTPEERRLRELDEWANTINGEIVDD